jgi:hypothetical protein
MREEFFLDYPGFGGFLSKCHLRIIVEPGKPAVVVCSQPPNNSGTSIQNAYEIIRDHVYKYLQEKLVEEKKNETAKAVDEFAETIENTKKLRIALIIFLLKQFSGKLKNKEGILDVLTKDVPEVVWIEHWPKGTGLNHLDVDYLQVSENEAGSPSWTRVSTSDLARKLGLKPSDIEIPENTLA